MKSARIGTSCSEMKEACTLPFLTSKFEISLLAGGIFIFFPVRQKAIFYFSTVNVSLLLFCFVVGRGGLIGGAGRGGRGGGLGEVLGMLIGQKVLVLFLSMTVALILLLRTCSIFLMVTCIS